MPLTSDITLNFSSFSEDAVTEQQRAFNEHLIKMTSGFPHWWEVGAAEYRKMQERGETPFPVPTPLASGRDMEIPSREQGRSMPCRVHVPPSSSSSGQASAGVLMHIHGGGWVLGSPEEYDVYCSRLAADSNVTVVSVGYRLAPEHPFPAGPEDCYDAAEWLARNAEAEYGAPLRVIVGDSAGAHLALLTAIHLLSVDLMPGPYLGVKAVLLHYGVFDLSELPAVSNFDIDLILSREAFVQATSQFVPQAAAEPAMFKRPDVSPFYADLKKLKQLPACFFGCGTMDPLLDDSLMMSVRWMAAGGEAVVKILPGLPHGYASVDPKISPAVGQNFTDVAEFLKSKLGS